MKIRRLPKVYRRLYRAAIEAGGEPINRKDGVLVRFPGGGSVIFHTSPGPKAETLMRGDLRRLGVDC